jgi:amino acid permease
MNISIPSWVVAALAWFGLVWLVLAIVTNLYRAVVPKDSPANPAASALAAMVGIIILLTYITLWQI